MVNNDHIVKFFVVMVDKDKIGNFLLEHFPSFHGLKLMIHIDIMMTFDWIPNQ